MTTGLGRSEPGEAWRRAMGEVAVRIAAGAKRRYRVRGRRIEAGWWTYDVRHARPIPEPRTREPVRMSRELIDEMGRTLPRCAQRSRANHGGNSKLALTDERIAEAMAEFLGVRCYPCPLSAPAIGEHWHLTTSRKRKR